jgi:tetratricopeptide (TPR) repeat protein
MKKIIVSLIALQLFAFSIGAQTTDREKLKNLNLQVVINFKAGNVDGALTLAKQAIELSSKVSATDSETAAAYFNLGTLYRFKNKYKEATENLQKALSIYQLDPAKNGRSLAKTLHISADVYALDGDEKKAVETYKLAYTTAETAFGKDSKEILPFLKSMSDVYIYEMNWDAAQESFVRRHNILTKNLPDDKKQRQQVEDDFYCFVHGHFDRDETFVRNKKFWESVQSDKEKKLGVGELVGKGKLVSGGVVNSTATYLAKPAYPSSARERRVSGVVPVRVTIDEGGKVIEARAICGDWDLRRVSEAAARASSFTPTLLQGQPVKVTGIIVYNFVAPR